MKPEDCVLYSGAAQGSEAAFGAAAERHGVAEVNFTFEGHNDARQRGLKVLSAAELQQGDVSLLYVNRLMGRNFPNTPLMRKVLQTIWHQVNQGQEIYVVGKILGDQTVMGGTGWGAEFAKLCNKPLFVFDQEREGWFRWTEQKFEPARDPVIGHSRIAGTGTRFPGPAALAAIEGLFDRTFR